LPILKGLRKNQEGGSLGDSRTFPDRVLKPFAQAFETLRETNRPRLPVGIARRLEVHLVEQSDRPPASVFAVVTIPAFLGTPPMLV